MSTLIVYSDTSDGRILSASGYGGVDPDYEHGSYASARAGTGSMLSADTGSLVGTVGQQRSLEAVEDQNEQHLFNVYVYRVFEPFLGFDTSSVGDSGTVSSATLTLTSNADNSATDFTIEARLYDWGTTVTTADFVPGADLSGDTLLASYGTSSGWTAGTSYAFTSQSAFAANINKTGTTRLCLSSSRTRTNNEPTGSEHVDIRLADYTGTTSDPKLTVEYSSGYVWDGPGPKLDAVILRAASSTLTANAVVRRTQEIGLSANAVVFAAIGGSFAADAYVAHWFAASAWIAAEASHFHADAIILGEQPGSASADAILGATSSGSATADAILLRSQSGSLSAAAVIKGTQTAAVPVDSIRLRTFWFGSVEAGF